MIEDIKLSYQIPGCEACTGILEVVIEGRRVTRTLNFGGNSTPAVLHGAISIVNELQELLGKEPLGHVQIPAEKRKKK